MSADLLQLLEDFNRSCRYTISELYRLRESIPFLYCPLEEFTPEAFQYLIVTPHIPASAVIEPRIRQKVVKHLLISCWAHE